VHGTCGFVSENSPPRVIAGDTSTMRPSVSPVVNFVGVSVPLSLFWRHLPSLQQYSTEKQQQQQHCIYSELYDRPILWTSVQHGTLVCCERHPHIILSSPKHKTCCTPERNWCIMYFSFEDDIMLSHNKLTYIQFTIILQLAAPCCYRGWSVLSSIALFY